MFAKTGDPSPPQTQDAVTVPAGGRSGVTPSPFEGEVLIQNETLPPFPAEIIQRRSSTRSWSHTLLTPVRQIWVEIFRVILTTRMMLPPSLSEALASAVFTVERIEDPILERLVCTGEELRGEGNISSALQALRQAEEALPDHPRVLAEMAVTLSQMGANPQADNYWQKLVDIGPLRAGDYYGLARKQLDGEEPATADKVERLMSIGEIKVNEAAPGSEGQKVALRIVIDSDPALKAGW